MRSRPEVSTRRDFLLAGFTLGSTLLTNGACRGDVPPPSAGTAPDGKSKVVIARDEKLRTSGAGLDADRLLKMLDRSMQTFFDRDDPVEAWRQVVRPGEVVGLKVNCLSGKGNSTRTELVDAICEGLQQAGIKEIVVWDRLNADLESARFRIAERGTGIRCFGNDTLGYEDELATFGSAGSLLAKTLTQVCDAIINLPVLKDHGIAGVTIALKNMFGVIHNHNKYHVTMGDPYIADVNMLPPIRSKVRLTICDATTAQYEGGPSFMPQWTWPFNGLIVGADPVALDYTGWRIIEKKRAEAGMKPLKEAKRDPAYIARAADPEHRLGTNDPRKIEVMEV